MDERTEQAVDTALQDELLRNERIITHPTFGQVKLKRPTPGQERLIAEARRRQYQSDMRDPDVLSKDQIEKLANERGMWSPDLTKRIEDLTLKTGEAMGLLDAIGFKSLDDLLKEFRDNTGNLLEIFGADEHAEIREKILAYFNLDGTPSTIDRMAISREAPSSSVDDLLDAGDTLRTQVELLTEMFKIRRELNDLTARQTRLYLDSIESRSDRAEQLARVYYCASNATTGKPLWPTYADIWDAAASEIEVLLVEMHYFLNGITPEFRDTLGKYGFIKRQSDTNGSSDDSPALPPSNSDGESPESEPTSSSPATE